MVYLSRKHTVVDIMRGITARHSLFHQSLRGDYDLSLGCSGIISSGGHGRRRQSQTRRVASTVACRPYVIVIARVPGPFKSLNAHQTVSRPPLLDTMAALVSRRRLLVLLSLCACLAVAFEKAGLQVQVRFLFALCAVTCGRRASFLC